MTLDTQASTYNARIVSSVAATIISLACGTNYVYSAWAPQFADKLLLSATESNLIGLAGNLGMYSMGVPVGMFVDAKGPRPAVIIGSVLLLLGYYPLHQAYDAGHASVGWLCFVSFLSGFGGCVAFAAAIKTSALNWPHHRGTATAFPLAAFGLSAFFFSLLGSLFFPGSPSKFLSLLAFGTFSMTFASFFFLRVLPHSPYTSVPAADPGLMESQEPHRSTSLDSPNSHAGRVNPYEPDIRGMNLLRNFEFWQLFTIMGILSGIGLMTINNIGNDVTALWKHYDDSIDDKTLVLRQQLHVSILSIGSFAGRLLSGVGSDFLVKVLGASRVWCLVIASGIFSLAQICALNVLNPHLLGFVSGFSGLGYGFLFGVFPSIVAESFGIHGLSQNWGFMTLSPVISSNVFNLFYGSVFDAHSVVEADGTRTCTEGIECYWSAYVVTLCACGLGFIVTLWVIWHQSWAKQSITSIKGHSVD
ncbi:major facilitator superfamily domain-containing protein [Biscogniauxia marginata]|nr:major facilitator superfamily domain-containing protein [Biscogniauxia marginata]